MTRIERAVNFLLAALCFAILIAMWPAVLHPGYGVPPKESLISYSGVLQSWKYKHVTRNREDIVFNLENNPNEFIYVSKGRGYKDITRALAVGAQITTLGKAYSGNIFNRNPAAIGVYEIKVNGSVVRSYEQVKEAWAKDDRLTPYLIALFVVGISIFLYQGITGRSLTAKKSGENIDDEFSPES